MEQVTWAYFWKIRKDYVCGRAIVWEVSLELVYNFYVEWEDQGKYKSWIRKLVEGMIEGSGDLHKIEVW